MGPAIHTRRVRKLIAAPRINLLAFSLMEKKLIISEVARLLGISVRRVRQLVAEGELPAESTPLGRLFTPEDVERLAAARRNRARADRKIKTPREPE